MTNRGVDELMALSMGDLVQYQVWYTHDMCSAVAGIRGLPDGIKYMLYYHWWCHDTCPEVSKKRG